MCLLVCQENNRTEPSPEGVYFFVKETGVGSLSLASVYFFVKETLETSLSPETSEKLGSTPNL